MEHAGGLGLSSYSSHSFVGSCAFSAPYLVGGSAADGYVSEETRLYERAFLTMLSSNGSLFWFGEDCLDIACTDDMTIPQTLDKLEYTRSQAPPPSKKHNMPRRISNIHIFEELINVSEADELVFGGDCVGKDPKTIKKKLSLNNNDFVVSPSRDGCTLTASLKTVRASTKIMSDKQTQHNSVTSGVLGDNKREENNALAIVAVRVLVGSMPDSMPREIIIMGSGRAIKLKNNVKRWYDFPLSDEEILLGIRNGFGECLFYNIVLYI